jgi:hypothetical protein
MRGTNVPDLQPLDWLETGGFVHFATGEGFEVWKRY